MKQIKIFDIAALLIALAVLTGFSIHAYSGSGNSAAGRIKTAGGEWYYPLDEDRQITVTGPIGETVIAFCRGSIKVLSSPCREQICVKHSSISRQGEWIACLPNQVLVTARAERSDGLDGISF